MVIEGLPQRFQVSQYVGEEKEVNMSIPPTGGATLIFDVELLKIDRK